jgi:hypothetical protein
VILDLNSPARFQLSPCTISQALQFTVPPDLYKTWTLPKTPHSLKITCNGVEGITYLFSSSEKAESAAAYSGAIQSIKFNVEDTASKAYRECTDCYFGGYNSIILKLQKEGFQLYNIEYFYLFSLARAAKYTPPIIY